MSRAVWTPQAEQDLEDIAYYIAVESGRPRTAESNVRQLREKCETYGSNPLLGQALSEVGEYRFFAFKRWVVVYWPKQDGIVIEAVIDSSRDFVRVFRDRLGSQSD
jgi:plasmid stabilization system protein ParE